MGHLHSKTEHRKCKILMLHLRKCLISIRNLTWECAAVWAYGETHNTGYSQHGLQLENA